MKNTAKSFNTGMDIHMVENKKVNIVNLVIGLRFLPIAKARGTRADGIGGAPRASDSEIDFEVVDYLRISKDIIATLSREDKKSLMLMIFDSL